MTRKAVVSQLRAHQKYERLVAATKGLPALPTAVVDPCDESSLRGALEAAQAGMIVPVLVGLEEILRGRSGDAFSHSRGQEQTSSFRWPKAHGVLTILNPFDDVHLPSTADPVALQRSIQEAMGLTPAGNAVPPAARV